MSNISEIRWLHFSDIHFNFKTYDTEKMRSKLKEYIKDLNLPEQDFLFITGDFRYAPDRIFLDKTKIYIEEIMDLIPGENLKLFFVPGNHDLERSKVRIAIIDGLKKTYLSGIGVLEKEGIETLKTSFKGFLDFVKDWEPDLFPDDNPHRIYVTEKANIICLNTAIISGRESNDEYGQLIVGIKNLQECLEKIDREKVTIACGHHSLESLSYDERIRVVELFQDYDIHIYLCGHDHKFIVNNVSDDEDYKLYEIFAGNLLTENQYSQCGFMEGYLNGSQLKLRCHEWDNNARIWYVSHAISKKGNEIEKWFDIKPINRYSDDMFLLQNETGLTQEAGEDVIKIFNDKISDPVSGVPLTKKSQNYVNILHLSDLQFGITEELSKKDQVQIDHRKMILEEKLVDFLCKDIPNEWKPHVVVISGDLAWNAVESDYIECGEWLKKLLSGLNIPLEQVITCPGNHDISEWAAEKNSKNDDTSLEKEQKELNKNIERIGLYENFREYINFCKGITVPDMSFRPFESALTSQSDMKYLYGFRDLFGIRFHVLNTSWYCGANRKKEDSKGDKEKLSIGKNFVLDLLHNLSSNDKLTVTVFHHPFDWLNREEGDDDSKVKKWLLKLSDIILCGHVHTRVGEPTFEHNRSQIFQSGALWKETKYVNEEGELKVNKEYVYESRIVRIDKSTGQVKQLTLEFDNENVDWKYRLRQGPNPNRTYSINYTEHPANMFKHI